jgi:hypothetical protein
VFRTNFLASIVREDEPQGVLHLAAHSVKPGAEIPPTRKCSSCQGNAGTIGRFCRHCGAKLTADPQSSSSSRSGSSPETFRFRVFHVPARRGAWVRSAMQCPSELSAAVAKLAELADDVEIVPGTVLGEEETSKQTLELWSRLLGALHFAGALVEHKVGGSGGTASAVGGQKGGS